MENNNAKERSWYKKKRYLLPLVTLGIIFALGSGGDSAQQVNSAPVVPAYNYNTIQVSPSAPIQKAISPYEINNLSNNNYYTNVNGNTVHSPAYSNSVPSGASARCGDGTYSFSQHRQGTCSHHRGVERWL